MIANVKHGCIWIDEKTYTNRPSPTMTNENDDPSQDAAQLKKIEINECSK